MKKINLSILFFGIMTIIACKKDSGPAAKPGTPGPTPEPAADIYIAGTVAHQINSKMVDVASYWKNGELNQVVDKNMDSHAYGIFENKNGNIMLAGDYNYLPCYWKDTNTRIDLPGCQNAWAVSLVEDDAGTIYILGRGTLIGEATQKILLWKHIPNQSPTLISSKGFLGKVKNIAVRNSIIYIPATKDGAYPGYYTTDFSDANWHPYFPPGTAGELGSAELFYFNDLGDIYSTSDEWKGYWKNSAINIFDINTQSQAYVNISGLAFGPNNNIYCSGSMGSTQQEEIATYWVNNDHFFIGNATKSEATGIAINGDHFYISGNTGLTFQAPIKSTPGYWKDGKDWTALTVNFPDQNNRAAAICIVKK